MLTLTLDKVAPTPARCQEILQSSTDEFGIPLDLDRMLEYYAYYTNIAGMAKAVIQSITGLTNVTGPSLGWWIRDVVGAEGFLLTPRGDISLSEESRKAALAAGHLSEEVKTVLELYDQASSASSAVNQFQTILEFGQLDKGLTYDKHRMIRVRPKWVLQNTGRIGMRNPGLMNVAKQLADIETVPEGYVYFTVDSGQIEPRIIQSAFIKDPLLKKCTTMYNDAYFGYVHYCTLLNDVQRASCDLNITPMEITPELQAKRKKFKTYGNAVMYGSKKNEERDPDKDAFIRCIGNHPSRVLWQKSIESRIDNGETVFNTIFGTPIDITQNEDTGAGQKYVKGTDAHRAHLIRCAINNPVQGTAADLMRFSISAAYNLLLRKAPKSYILRYTHDSGTFAIHVDDYDKVIDELRGITSYQVEDWIPVYGDPQEGIIIKSGIPRLLN